MSNEIKSNVKMVQIPLYELKDLLILFWQSKSDACPLEVTEAEQQEKEFSEWIENKYKYDYNLLQDAFVEGYKQRALASGLVFDESSRLYAIELYNELIQKHTYSKTK